MYNPPTLNLDSLQQQLDILKQHQSMPLQPPYGNYPPQQPPVNYQEIIQKTVQDEIQKLLNTQVKPQEQTPVAPPMSELEKQINDFAASVLTPDQMKWLSDPVIASHIPIFFKSVKGKEAIAFLVDEYKTYVDGK
jgi:hypothetical protein